MQALERRLGHLDGVIGGLIKVAEHTALWQRLDRFDNQLDRLTDLLTLLAGQVASQNEKLVEMHERQAANPGPRHPVAAEWPPASNPKRAFPATEFLSPQALLVNRNEITLDRTEGGYDLGIDSAAFTFEEAVDSEGPAIHTNNFDVDKDDESGDADGESGAHKVETVEDTAEMEIHSEEDEASRGTSPLSEAVSTQGLGPPTASTPQSPAQMMHEELAPATAVESTPNTLLASDALAPEDIIVHT